MGKVHAAIEGRLRTFVEAQHVFFVATAPLAGDGLINISPRGITGTFKVLDEHTFAWLDTNGSGSETIGHLRENGRITVMFCAFEGPPNIVRLHGRGRVVSLYDDDYPALREQFVEFPQARAVIVVDVDRVSDSCGYGVPFLDYREDRTLMHSWSQRKGDEGTADYRRRKNRTSLDGLPAFDFDPLDEWSTLDGLAAIRERMAAQIDGFEQPASYALALDGELGHVNAPGGRHGLPAVVLATVLKHDGSTATLPVAREQLDEAITTLTPAAACTEVDHPNLAAWRRIAARLDANGGGTVEAVFVRSADDPVSSELDATLRAAW